MIVGDFNFTDMTLVRRRIADMIVKDGMVDVAVGYDGKIYCGAASDKFHYQHFVGRYTAKAKSADILSDIKETMRELEG